MGSAGVERRGGREGEGWEEREEREGERKGEGGLLGTCLHPLI